MIKIQTFEWIKYESCKVIGDATSHIVRLQEEINTKIIIKTSSGEICCLKPTGNQEILIYGNIARYDESIEEIL